MNRLKSVLAKLPIAIVTWYWAVPFVLRWAVWLLVLILVFGLLELAMGHQLYVIDVTMLKPTDAAMVQAAWFQAIGSVAAIVAAIWLANSQARREEARVSDERKRRAFVEGGVLVALFQGVVLESRSKGGLALELARSANVTNLRELHRTDVQRFHFASLELLEPRYDSVAWFSTALGSNIAMAIAFLLPYNATLRDVTTRPVDDESKLRQMYFDLARRAVTAQQVAHQALLLLQKHPSTDSEMLASAGDFDWYDVGDVDFEVSPLPPNFTTDFS